MSIIKNYGLRWSRHNVEWGSKGKGNEGKLNGKKATSKSSGEVDFRNQIGVYVLYESNYTPIYIGQAGNGNAKLFDRLKLHKIDHLRDRWTHFSWFGFCAVDDRRRCLVQKDNQEIKLSVKSALNEIEGILIQVLEPRLNKQGPRFQKTADEYVQWGYDDQDPHALSFLLEKIDGLTGMLEALKGR